MKKILSLGLVFVLALGLCATFGKKAEAASTVKITLIAGEKYTITPIIETNTFKSVKTSKKKVATVKKTKSLVTITAKKAGKSTITVKSKSSTTKYIVTVKAKRFDSKAYTPSNTYNELGKCYSSSVLLEVTNKTGVYLSGVQVSYAIYGTSGKKLTTGSKQLEELVPGAKLHIFYKSDNFTEAIKTAKVTKVTLMERDYKLKYTDRSSKVTVSEASMDAYILKLNIANSLSIPVNGKADVVFFSDTACKRPIGLSTISIYTNADSTGVFPLSVVDGTKAYKVYKRAWTSKIV